jgi:multisubunit Na+/H+ antiporter MnhE subunit
MRSITIFPSAWRACRHYAEATWAYIGWLVMVPLLWVCWSGRVSQWPVACVVTVAVIASWHRRFEGPATGDSVASVWRVVGYAVRWVGEIVRSSWSVIRVALGPLGKLRDVQSFPWVIVRTRPDHPATWLYAQSVTLTPGTITITLAEDQLFIHCLEPSEVNERSLRELKEQVEGLWQPLSR